MGYQNNVLLSDANRHGSAFWDTGGEITLLRVPLDGTEVHFTLTGDDYRYWRDIGVTHQDLWLLSAEVRREFAADWKAGLLAQYTYLNQVVDLFDFENHLQQPPALITGHGFTLRPSLQKLFGNGWTLAWEFDGVRQFLSSPADSFTRFGPRAVLGFHPGKRTEINLGYSYQPSFFEHQSEVDGDGYPLANTSLVILRQQVVLGGKYDWDSGRHWQTSLNLGFTDAWDGGAGFYNYRDYGVGTQLRYRGQRWELLLGGGLSYRDFPVQTVSPTDPAKLHQALGRVNVRLEHKLLQWLKVYAAWEREVSLSDSPDEVYHADTLSAGLDWMF